MVYLIHFNKAYKGVKHYIGYSADENFENRMHHHRRGTGARLMRAIKIANINWKVVRKWPGEDGNFERMLKNKRNHALLCPICAERKKKQIARQRKQKAKQLRKQLRALKTNV